MKVNYLTAGPSNKTILAAFEDGRLYATHIDSAVDTPWNDITPQVIKNQPVEDPKPGYELVQACRSLVQTMLGHGMQWSPYTNSMSIDLETNKGLAQAVGEAEKLWIETRDKAAKYDAINNDVAGGEDSEEEEEDLDDDEIEEEDEEEDVYREYTIVATSTDRTKKKLWWDGESGQSWTEKVGMRTDFECKEEAEEYSECLKIPEGYDSITVEAV